MNQQPTRTPRRSRRRASGRNYWPWALAVAALAALFVAWPIDAYGEGALWGAKRAADDNIRAPIVGVFASGEQSSGASAPRSTASPTLASVERAVAASDIVVSGTPESRQGFYGLIAECGGAAALEDALIEEFVGPKPEAMRRGMLREGYKDVKVELVKREYGWVITTKAVNPTLSAAGLPAVELEEVVVLHMRERVEWLPTPTPAPQATATPPRDGLMPAGFSPFDPTPTPEPTATPRPEPTPAHDSYIAWEIKYGNSTFARTMEEGVLRAGDCNGGQLVRADG